jgi:hypothetical protein
MTAVSPVSAPRPSRPSVPTPSRPFDTGVTHSTPPERSRWRATAHVLPWIGFVLLWMLAAILLVAGVEIAGALVH